MSTTVRAAALSCLLMGCAVARPAPVSGAPVRTSTKSKDDASAHAAGLAKLSGYDRQIEETLFHPQDVEIVVLETNPNAADKLHGHAVRARKRLVSPASFAPVARGLVFALSTSKGEAFSRSECRSKSHGFVVRGALVLDLVVCEEPAQVDFFRSRDFDGTLDPERAKVLFDAIADLAKAEGL
jgi:hypothetical protein